jgi:hypothetical protein
MSLTVGDKYTLVDADGKAVTQVVANVADTIDTVFVRVDMVDVLSIDYDGRTAEVTVTLSLVRLVDGQYEPVYRENSVNVDLWLLSFGIGVGFSTFPVGYADHSFRGRPTERNPDLSSEHGK